MFVLPELTQTFLWLCQISISDWVLDCYPLRVHMYTNYGVCAHIACSIHRPLNRGNTRALMWKLHPRQLNRWRTRWQCHYLQMMSSCAVCLPVNPQQQSRHSQGTDCGPLGVWSTWTTVAMLTKGHFNNWPVPYLRERFDNTIRTCQTSPTPERWF